MPNLTKSVALLGAAALVISVGACQKYGNNAAGNAAATADTGAIADAITADEKKWNDEFQAKPMNLDALTAHYANDATFVAPGLKPTTGMADIRKAYGEALKDPNFGITISPGEVDVASGGDYAIAQGHFTESFTDPATKQKKSDGGSYLTVYKKQGDGSWKAIQDWAVADPAQ
jgi:ketosteroid isomerase-like protein